MYISVFTNSICQLCHNFAWVLYFTLKNVNLMWERVIFHLVKTVVLKNLPCVPLSVVEPETFISNQILKTTMSHPS